MSDPSTSHFEVIANLMTAPSGETVWSKQGPGDGSLQLKGTQEVFALSHVFQGATTDEIYTTSINRIVQYGPTGVNVSILCFGYTDFVSLAQRALNAIVAAPDGCDRFVSATAIHIGEGGELRSIFDRKATPTVNLWYAESGLCVGNTPYRTLTTSQDVSDFFAVPMIGTDATLIVAEVFHAIEPRKQTRATVLILYVPEGSTALNMSVWATIESEVDKGPTPSTLFFTIVGNVFSMLKCFDTKVVEVGGLKCFGWDHGGRVAAAAGSGNPWVLTA